MSLREALAGKRSRQTHYDMVVGDTDGLEERLSAARAALRLAQHREDADATGIAQTELDAALAAVQACLHRIVFRALEPDVFEALVGTHPPTAQQRDDGDRWNASTFEPALLAACAVDSDLTEAEWATELGSGRWSLADRQEAFACALAANVIPRSLSVPKG